MKTKKTPKPGCNLSSDFMPNKNDTRFSKDSRVNEILEVIYAFARLDFNRKVNISGEDDALDGIGTGVNMLGEELNHSKVTLREKEQLLKEIHHRVKNNLQIVSSLLSLQSENVVDESFLNMIRESKNRINSMALVHEMLYKSKDINRVELKEYIKSLTQSLISSFSTNKNKVSIILNIGDNIFLEIDKMIPVGLILNELISNSFKYAFTSPDNNEIKIAIYLSGDLLKLEVSDNGKGIHDSVPKSTSLGLQLIRMLSEQLNGTSIVRNENGAKFELIFPYL